MSTEEIMQLPDAILQAWDSVDPGKLGGWMALTGIDPEEVFRSKAIRDHPWLGLEVSFPFPEVGKGQITRCVIHPRGQLMFDVTFPEPVPPIQGAGPEFRVVLQDSPEHYQEVYRFFGHELKAILEGGRVSNGMSIARATRLSARSKSRNAAPADVARQQRRRTPIGRNSAGRPVGGLDDDGRSQVLE
jgi:hypothetical protein